MKNIFNSKNLPWLMLASGGLGLALHLWLLSTADSDGFLAVWHISEILLWLLSASVIAVLFLLTHRLLEAPKYTFNFPSSAPCGFGSWLGALGIGGTSLIELLNGGDVLGIVTALLGLAAAAALIILGLLRIKGFRPAIMLHGGICVYLMIRIICLYRHWSSDPQLIDYCFQILALISMMIAVYYRATFDADFGKRRPYAFFNLLAVYFCCLALPGWENTAFFLGCGAWMFTDTCNLTPMPAHVRRAPQQEDR